MLDNLKLDVLLITRARGMYGIYCTKALVITILYPEGTATIATALRCLTTRASYFVIAIRYKTRSLR